MITPIVINRLKWRAYLIFMATNVVFVPIIYFFYPETSNLRLEDIDYIFSAAGNPVTNARKMEGRIKQGLVPVEHDPEAINKEHMAGDSENVENAS